MDRPGGAGMRSAILWDLDDTLLDTLSKRMRALDYAYEACFGSKTDALALWRSHRGGSLEALGERLLGADGPRFVTLYRDRYDSDPAPVEPHRAVEPLLAACAEHGVPMAVVTNKISWGATDELARAGLLQYISAVVGADDTERQKPDAEPVFAALERLVVDDPAGAVLIGDTPADILAARNAGCISAAALWGTLDEELVLDAGPQHVARHPMDLLPVLGFRLERTG